ncbi:hypothetical protein ACIBBE_02920 [Streptomyces sp. NPDC051644]|uniref:hypothetical protein n=1 Tax=Streptomyces sp. NPDC051644 TaxID=3365666 RepID=UPI0037AFAA43
MSDGADRPGAGAGAGAVAPASGAVGATPVALDLPETAEALERYRGSVRRWFGGGAAGVCAAVFIAVFVSGGSLFPTLGGFGGALLLGGAIVRSRARRMRRVLSAGPWVAHTSVTQQSGTSGAVVVLSGPGPGELLALTPFTTQWRLHLLSSPAGVLWWCGDPRTGGVLAPPGGTELIWARPVRSRRARSVAARPQVVGLRTRPAPRQPQITVHGANGESADPAAPATESEVRTRRPWWRGVFRWVLVVGCLLVALATGWSEASDHDPQVDLTVIAERSDGRCAVRWTDPFGGQKRTGLFHCHQYRGPLEGWETGFVVSYPPFKGDLYDSELRGTSAFTATDIVGVGGLALVAAGAVGGAVRFVVRARRRRAERVPRHPLPDRPSTAAGRDGRPDGEPSAGTYVAYTAVAERQARLRGPDPVKPRTVGDVRVGQEVRWWRVPALRHIAGVGAPVFSLGYSGVIAVLSWVPDSDEVPVMMQGAAVLSAVFGLFMAWQTIRSGVPVARRLARAVVAPEPRIRRYALLYAGSGAGDGPLLVLFPAEGTAEGVGAGTGEAFGEKRTAGSGEMPGEAGEGGQDARPEGLLRLLPPGPDKCPWAGLPAPAGTVELRGWLDGKPVVVAWIEGRPYWPADLYQNVDPSDPGALETLADMVPGPV